VDLKEIVWIHVAQDRVQWWALVDAKLTLGAIKELDELSNDQHLKKDCCMEFVCVHIQQCYICSQ
jgi:hypothetical protein